MAGFQHHFAILTSGGDNAGLNAIVRAAVRAGIKMGVVLHGVSRGYRGLRDDVITPLTTRSVSQTIGMGGTWLGTARLQGWNDPRVRRDAIRNLNKRGIEGLIVIGGNGSLTGAHELAGDGFPVVGIPGSIDDDVNGTEVCIGVDTAANLIIEQVDRIRDCAASIQRAFLVEVMGRNSGALALMAAAGSGAECCLVPEKPEKPTMDDVAQMLLEAYAKGKPHCVVIVAEGWKPGTNALLKHLEMHADLTGFEVRATNLGYVQRGGSPTYRDRSWGTEMGVAAVRALLAGETDKMVGVVGGKIELIPLTTVVGKLKPLNEELYNLYVQLRRV